MDTASDHEILVNALLVHRSSTEQLPVQTVASSSLPETKQLDKGKVREEAQNVYQRQNKGCLHRSQLRQATSDVASSLGLTLPEYFTAILESPGGSTEDAEISLDAFVHFTECALQSAGRQSMHIGNLVDMRRTMVKAQSVFSDSFELLKPLGEGAYGKVLLCRDRKSNLERVVKIIEKANKSPEDIQTINREVEVLRNLNHPHIVRLYEALEDDQNFQLIFETCSGGELVKEMGKAENGGSSEMIACILQQILSAVTYCHEQSIVHQDLKLENVLLAEPFVPGATPHVVVADFGIADVFAGKAVEQKATVSGTPMYMAPERWYGTSTPRGDVWSVGIIAFVLLTGNFPWPEPQKTETPGKAPRWGSIKDSKARRLVKRMLCWNVAARPDAKDCLNHEWFGGQGMSGAAEPDANEDHSDKLEVSGDGLRAFCKRNEIERIASQICVWNLPHSALADVTKKFKEMDLDNDSRLTFHELEAGLESILGPDWRSLPEGQELCEALKVFEALDTDLSGSITWTEFAAGVVRLEDEQLEQTLYGCFQAFDADHSHCLERVELEGMLHLLHFGPNIGGKVDSRIAREIVSIGKSVDDMLTEMDQDNNGNIDFTEFKAYLKRQLDSV